MKVAALLCGIIGGVIQLVIAGVGLGFGLVAASIGADSGIAGARPADWFHGMKSNQRQAAAYPKVTAVPEPNVHCPRIAIIPAGYLRE